MKGVKKLAVTQSLNFFPLDLLDKITCLITDQSIYEVKEKKTEMFYQCNAM